MKEEMNEFLKNLAIRSNITLTENGANALSSTLSPLLDLFGTVGSLRSRSEQDIIDLFAPAFNINPLLALKTLFYARDIRGGLGERRTFRVIAKYLADNHTEYMSVNINLIPVYGRYDDLYAFVDTKLESAAFALMYSQYEKDLTALAANEITKISLLAKWLKSINTSSHTSRCLGLKTATAFKETPTKYRKHLSALRAALKIVERDMSAQRWSDINYSAVPSLASLRYRNAFINHDQERYQEFINSVEKGEAKINAATLYPYDLVSRYIMQNAYGEKSPLDATVEAQWKSLPNYLTDKDRFLVMVDTSGSMTSSSSSSVAPINVSVGLGIYFAEHSTGPFANKFITFTDTPRLVDIPSTSSTTLRDKVNYVMKDKYVGYNTNLEAAFDLVLKSAVASHLPQEDLPTAIVVISDMEIDQFGSHDDSLSFTQEMSSRFAAAGYTMPTIVYWNVAARNNIFHATASDNVRFVSGASPTVFKGLCEHLGLSATELMLSTLADPRYDLVSLPNK